MEKLLDFRRIVNVSILIFALFITACKKSDTPSPIQKPVEIIPAITLTAYPLTVPYGGSTAITWTTINAVDATSSIKAQGTFATNAPLTDLIKDTIVTVTAKSSTGHTTKAEVKIKVEPPPPKLAALMAHAWKPTGEMYWSGIAWHDLFKPCQIDDTRTFFAGGKGIFKQGADKCLPDFPENMDFSWTYSLEANGVITLTKWSANIWTIEVCTDDLLILSTKDAPTKTEVRLTFIR